MTDETFDPTDGMDSFAFDNGEAHAIFPAEKLNVACPQLMQTAEEVAYHAQADVSVAFFGLLAQIANISQMNIDVVSPIQKDKMFPTALNILVLADSGERKSAVDNLCSTAIHQYAKINEKVYRQQRAEYFEKKEAYKADFKKRMKEPEADPKTGEVPPDLVAPTTPENPKMIISDTTQEGLFRAFQFERCDYLMTSDEGAGIFNNVSFRDTEIGRAVAMFNRLFDGSPIERNRATDYNKDGGGGSIALYGRRLTVFIQIQPEMAKQLLGNKAFDGSGFDARFLWNHPMPKAGTRQLTDIAKPTPNLDRFNERIRHLLWATRPCTPDNIEGRVRHGVHLDRGAINEIRKAWQWFETEQREGGAFADMKPHAVRATEVILRIAACLAFFRDARVGELGPPLDLSNVVVRAEDVVTGGLIVLHSLNTKRGSKKELDKSEDDANLKLVWDECLRLKDDNNRLTWRFLTGRCKNKLRGQTDMFRTCVAKLVDMGNLVQYTGNVEIVNGERAKSYYLVVNNDDKSRG